ncbi:Hypothetical protein D9617_19g102240 [Elsinoe fawcettii]|nr:Hypothetical protein D9617_19g102240 [Elsinoe fawcettii]
MNGFRKRRVQPCDDAESALSTTESATSKLSAPDSKNASDSTTPRKSRRIEAASAKKRTRLREDDALKSPKTPASLAIRSPTKLRSNAKRAEVPQSVQAFSLPTVDSSDDDLPVLPSKRMIQLQPVAPGNVKSHVARSHSPLSSLSATPEYPPISSSQRVIKDGQEMVVDSDPEEETLESPAERPSSLSDDVSDDDMEAAIAAESRRLLAEMRSKSPEPGTDRSERQSIRGRHDRTSRTKHASGSYPTPPKNDSKNSIQAILARKQKDEEARMRMEEMDNEVRLRHDHVEAVEKMLEREDGNHEQLVATVDEALDDDESTERRVKRAIKALDKREHDVEFHFFDTVLEADQTRQKFPGTMGKADNWVEILSDDRKRDQAAESGFIADMCRVKPLPAELQEWFLGEVIFEDRDELSHAYVEILVECAQHVPLSPALDLVMLRDSMTRLGARNDIVDECSSSGEDPGSFEARRKAKIGRRGLYNFLNLLSQLKDKVASDTLGAALHYCCLIMVDDNIAQLPHLLLSVEETVSNLFAESHRGGSGDSHLLATRLLSRLNHPVLVSRLLSRLPSLNPQAALFKRQFAYLTTTGRFPDSDRLSSHGCWAEIHTAIASQDFIPNRQTDYAVLAARYSMLDLAVGNGFSTFSFLPQPASRNWTRSTTPSTPAEDDKKHDKRMNFFAKRKGPEEPSEEEQAFNEAVQVVANRARKVNMGIKDAGAVAMEKTECKGVIEGMVRRLEGQVRTRRRERAGIFGL